MRDEIVILRQVRIVFCVRSKFFQNFLGSIFLTHFTTHFESAVGGGQIIAQFHFFKFDEFSILDQSENIMMQTNL